MRFLISSLILALPALALAQAEPQLTQSPSAEVSDAAPAEFRQDFRGAFLHGTYVVDIWGKAIPIQLGFEWAGIRSFRNRSLLFTFDGAANVFAAYGGNSDDRFILLGGQARLVGELGARLTPTQDNSFYLGGTVALDGNAVSILGVPVDQYNLKNSLSGIAGLYGSAGLRVNAGLSHLHSNHALLVEAFVAEVLVAPGSSASGPLFTDFGARGQLDLVKNLTAVLEVSWGTTFARVDQAGVRNTGTHWLVTAMVKKQLGPVWLALDGQVRGTTNTAVVKPLTFVTSTPTVASLGLQLGVNL